MRSMIQASRGECQRVGARLGCGHYSSKRCANLPRSEVNTCFLCFCNDSISEGVKRGLAGFDSSGTVGFTLVVWVVAGSFCFGISCPSLGGYATHLSSLHCNELASSSSAASTTCRLVCPVRAVRMVSVYPVDKFYASIPAVSVFDAATA